MTINGKTKIRGFKMADEANLKFNVIMILMH
jgi:hypothetical protein